VKAQRAAAGLRRPGFIARAAGVFGLYALTGALALWALLRDPAVSVGATLPTDYYHFLWNYDWMTRALAAGTSIYTTDAVLAPAITNLSLHTLTPVYWPVWRAAEPVLRALTGHPLAAAVAAMNLLYVLALALTGALCALFLRREGAPRLWALAGGLAYQLTPALLLAAFLGDINYVSGWPYPALLLLWGWAARAGPVAAAARGAAFGLGLFATAHTDYQHLVFAAFLLVPYAAWAFVRADRRARAAQLAAGAVGIGVFALLLWAGGTLPALLAFDRAGLAPQPLEAARGIPFPAGYIGHLSPYSTRLISLNVVPAAAALFALLTGVRAADMRAANMRGRGVQVADMRGRSVQVVPDRRWLWLIALVVPALVSPGPAVTLGPLTLPTLYPALYDLFGGLFRSPARFAPVLVLAALTAGGIAAARFSLPRRFSPPARFGLAAALVLVVSADARLFAPMPTRRAVPPYAAHAALAVPPEPGRAYARGVVLDVPTAGGSGEAWVGGGTHEFLPMETQAYALVHGHRVVNGSVARAPLASFWGWLYDDALMAWLGGRRYLGSPAAMRARLDSAIAAWPMRAIVVHTDLIGREQPAVAEILGFLNAQRDRVCPFAVERAPWSIVGEGAGAPAVFYSAAPCPAVPSGLSAAHDPAALDLGSDADHAVIGWGWNPPEVVAGTVTWRWAGAQHPAGSTAEDAALVHVYAPPGAAALVLTMQYYGEPGTVAVSWNGVPIGTAVVAADALRDYRFALSPAIITPNAAGVLRLAYTRAADVGGRRLAFALDRVGFEQAAARP
jgi:hypothetical protein